MVIDIVFTSIMRGFFKEVRVRGVEERVVVLFIMHHRLPSIPYLPRIKWDMPHTRREEAPKMRRPRRRSLLLRQGGEEVGEEKVVFLLKKEGRNTMHVIIMIRQEIILCGRIRTMERDGKGCRIPT